MAKKLPAGFVIVLMVMAVLAGICAAAEYPAVQIRGVVKYIVAENSYGILASDGKKYQPVKPLPKEFRKDGLEVVIDARVRPDIVAARMWGAATEVLAISRADRYISAADRQAIKLLLQRLEAFNAKDLKKLQQIDAMSQSLTQEQFLSWLGGYGNFTLRYVEAVQLDASTIVGYCLYTRELQNGMALSGNLQRSFMQFRLKQSGASWIFDGTGPYRPEAESDLEGYIQELTAKTKQKYGTDNLALWKG